MFTIVAMMDQGLIEEVDDGGFFASACSGMMLAMLTGCWFAYCLKNNPKKIYIDNIHQQYNDKDN